MEQETLDEIKAREQAATPGKWYVVPNDDGNYSVFTDVNGIPYKIGEVYLRHDAEIAAHARTDIPALLVEVERQDQQIATLKRALSDMLFAYQNKDSDFPNRFEIEAVRKAKKTLERAFEQAQEQEVDDEKA